jgi:anti-anti-sigma factor
MKVREREVVFDYVIVDFIGDAETMAMDVIQEGLRKAATKQDRIVCTMSEVRHINSAGVNAFLLSAKKIIAGGGEIIFCGMLPNVERVFKLGRLDKYLKFFPRLKDAEEYYRTRGRIDMSENENILIIEKKNAFIRKHIEDINKKGPSVSQIQAYTAKSTEQAMRFLDSKRFSVALLDSTFSLGEGKDFIEKMLSAEGQPNLPILVVATSDTMEKAQYFIRSGAHDIIQFPFNPVEVQSRLRFMMAAAKQMKPD